jgi:hypothetical protein
MKIGFWFPMLTCLMRSTNKEIQNRNLKYDLFITIIYSEFGHAML